VDNHDYIWRYEYLNRAIYMCLAALTLRTNFRAWEPSSFNNNDIAKTLSCLLNSKVKKWKEPMDWDYTISDMRNHFQIKYIEAEIILTNTSRHRCFLRYQNWNSLLTKLCCGYNLRINSQNCRFKNNSICCLLHIFSRVKI
jgi:hypothetical protein